MNTASGMAFSSERPKPHQAILWGGLIAGVMDLTAACVHSGTRGMGPTRVFQAVASGLLGAAASQGGFAIDALGVLCHFFIATGATAVYYAASRRLDWLVKYAVPCGLLYGIAVFWFMRLVVLPLSAITFKPSNAPSVVLVGILIHMFCVGLPISLVIRKFSKG
jgi:uncharacterized membrane protein YagU involved in acid resistance